VTVDAFAYLYPWTKAFHLVSVIAWMAALLYLPRLFIYHCEVAPGSAESARFKTMERRLLKLIANPAGIASWLFGVTLVLTPGVVDWSSGWWHLKILGVLVITGSHHGMMKWRREFLLDQSRRPQKFFRIWNEVPTVAMILVVFMVIGRPF